MHIADMLAQPALVTGRLVGMDQALAGGAVDHRHGGLVSRFRLRLVAGGDSLHHLFDIRAHPGAQASVVPTAFLGLPDTFFRLQRVSQGRNPVAVVKLNPYPPPGG